MENEYGENQKYGENPKYGGQDEIGRRGENNNGNIAYQIDDEYVRDDESSAIGPEAGCSTIDQEDRYGTVNQGDRHGFANQEDGRRTADRDEKYIVINNGRSTTNRHREYNSELIRRTADGSSKSDLRRQRIRRRRQDMAIRIALIFLTGFLCGSLFTWLFLRPKPVPASAAVNNPNENEAAPAETDEGDVPEAGQQPVGVVVIDAGHGGKDPGCMESSVWESEINLQMAFKLQEKLEARGVQVLMTRTDDEVTLSLAERADLANDNKADLFISIHQNSYTSPDVSGIEFFYNPYKKEGGEGSELLANIFEEKIQADGSIKSRGPKANEGLKVLRTTTVPAVLIESGYLTNPTEEKNLLSDSYQDKLMGYIADGVMEFLEEKTE